MRRFRGLAGCLVWPFCFLLCLLGTGTILKFIAVSRLMADPAASLVHNKTFDVLIIGYLRGGTTFMGEILGFRDESYYIFEPLFEIQQFGYMDHGIVCSMMDETCSKNNMTDEQILDIIRGIYTCNSRKYLHLIQEWQYNKSIGPRKRIQFDCNRLRITCPENYLDQCSTATSKVSKVPRIGIAMAAKLLSEFPNLKIIYLLRDPRAIMHSRTRINWTPVPDGARSLCKKMKNDFRESVKLAGIFPGRIKTVFYEDLTEHFEETIKDIYAFVGYLLDRKDQYRFSMMTSSSYEGDFDSTFRRNSAFTARAWRYNISTSVLVETNKACFDLYKALGYPELASMTDVKNMDTPLRVNKEGIDK